MRRIRSTVLFFGAALTASLVLGAVHPFGDAGMFARSGSAPTIDRAAIPPEVRAILLAKCADCHSLQTHAPLYAHLAPASWLMERDILKARTAMNLSQWESYSADDQERLKAKIAFEAKRHEMPPPQYLAVHWNAHLTDGDARILAQWAGTSGPVDSAKEVPGQGDAVRGKAVFEKRCTGCHALNQNREGPRLQGVYGRTAGSVDGFDYSNALRNSHIVWSDATLEQWLTDTAAVVPDNDMDFHVAKPDERADVIQFLRQQSGK
jgi:cytochrome c